MEELTEAFAALVVRQPGMSSQIRAEHVPDAAGDCKKCSAGPQVGPRRWPCTIYALTQQALERAEAHR